MEQSLPVLEESRIDKERNRVSRVSSRATGIRTWKELAREVKLVVNKEFLILRLQWRAKSQEQLRSSEEATKAIALHMEQAWSADVYPPSCNPMILLMNLST